MSAATPTASRNRAEERPARTMLRRLARHRSVQVGTIGVITLVVLAILAPVLTPYSATDIEAKTRLLSPSLEHPFGTDQFGRDVLTRVLFGARLSIPMGLVPVLVGSSIGITLGVIFGYFRRLDLLLMRFLDVALAFPALVLALTMTAILGGGMLNIMIALGLAGIPYFARMARGQVRQARTNLYVEYAVGAGAGHRHIITVHLVQSLVAPILVMVTIGIGAAILAGSALSFLGLGPSPPTPGWGVMLQEGRDFLRLAWWMSVFPGLAIVVVVVSFNLLGDGLRDVLDPRMRKELGP
ncbi:MAG: ABC transporter permease [Chloroflexota bacterium]